MFDTFNRRFGGGWLRRGDRMITPLALAEWQPTDVTSANVVIWCRADTVVLNGSDVETWTDLSGNGNDLTTAAAAERPAYNASDANFNSEPSMTFDGLAVSGNFLRFPDNVFDSLTAADMFFVGKKDADPPGSANTAGSWIIGSSGSPCYLPYTDGVVYEGAFSTTRDTTGNPTPDLANAFYYEIISTASEWTSRFNGSGHYTTGTNTFGVTPSPRLGYSSTTSRGYDGEAAELIIYDAKLSTADRTTVEAYIADRYAI